MYPGFPGVQRSARGEGNESFRVPVAKISLLCSASHVTKLKNASIIFPGQQRPFVNAVPESPLWKGEDA